ncbi:MAG: hypothetical protein V3W04_13815 [Gammaproteobacteria bacterium]
MSEWAIGNGDIEERTAYEYRELSLDQNIKFKVFLCPFCDIPLIPVNLYKIEELARSPHFRISKEAHRYGCDGSPKRTRIKEVKPAKRHVEKREFHLPEALIPRRTTVVSIRVDNLQEKRRKPNENEIDQRRQEAANRLGPAIYKTSLIRSIATAFLDVFKESYKQQKANKWSEEERRKWATTLLKTSHLTLYESYTLTYHSAIRNMRFPPPSKPRIFHGWGQVTCNRYTPNYAEYQIIPNTMIEHTINEKTQYYPVEITIRITLNDEPIGSQRLLIKQLEKATTQTLEVRWFAYGTISLCNDGVYRTHLSQTDHLYLHKLRKPIA